MRLRNAERVEHGADVVALEHGRNGAQKPGLVANCEVITVGQVVGLTRLIAAGHGRNAAGKNEHNILAKLGEVLILAAAKALPEAHKQQQRPNAPGNAEHGQKRAQLVRPQCGERLPNDVDEHSHRYR